MFRTFIERLTTARAIKQPTEFIGQSILEQVERAHRFGRALLRAIGKGWSFFKDIHFGWYVLVPVVSSTSALGDAVSVLTWGVVAMLALALLVFALLDSLLGQDSASRALGGRRTARSPVGTPPPTALLHRPRAVLQPIKPRWSRSTPPRTTPPRRWPKHY